MSSQPVGRDSAALRVRVDAAVGSRYETPFLRLDLLATTREARCGCRACAAVVAGRRDDIVAALPPV